MKKKIFLLLSLTILLTLYFLDKGQEELEKGGEGELETSDSSSDDLSQNTLDLTINNDIYKVVWYPIRNNSNLHLYSNLQNSLTSEEFVKENKCRSIFNGGFYNEKDKHIGLFISDGSIISNLISSSLFNSVFSVNFSDTSTISSLTDPNSRLAVQSGPLIVRNDVLQNISLENDKKARRVLLGISDANEAIFIAIYSDNSLFLGPNLSDVPEIINIFEQQSEINLLDVINLDGGSASVYYAGNVKLEELTLVGSFFCEKS